MISFRNATIPKSFRDVSCWKIAILRPERARKHPFITFLKESDFTEYLYMMQVITVDIYFSVVIYQ